MVMGKVDAADEQRSRSGWRAHLRLIARRGVLQRQHIQALALLRDVGSLPPDDGGLPGETRLTPQHALVLRGEHRQRRIIVAALHIAVGVPSTCATLLSSNPPAVP